MNNNYLTEKANCLRNEMNHLWGAMFITGGGAIGFAVIETKNLWIYCFMILGALMAIVFLNAYMTRRIELMQIVNEIKKGE